MDASNSSNFDLISIFAFRFSLLAELLREVPKFTDEDEKECKDWCKRECKDECDGEDVSERSHFKKQLHF